MCLGSCTYFVLRDDRCDRSFTTARSGSDSSMSRWCNMMPLVRNMCKSRGRGHWDMCVGLVGWESVEPIDVQFLDEALGTGDMVGCS